MCQAFQSFLNFVLYLFSLHVIYIYKISKCQSGQEGITKNESAQTISSRKLSLIVATVNGIFTLSLVLLHLDMASQTSFI